MKAISTSLLADLSAGVTTLAMLVTITRDDSTKICFTSHDTPLTFQGQVYRNDLPFTVSALTQNSDLSVDSSELVMAVDGVVITKQDVGQDLYRGGTIEIALVNWTNITHGKMVLRQGWFTSAVLQRPQTLTLEIGGLMKVLDMNVGRIYAPQCDATFGDKRCRVATDLSQAHSSLNAYGVGDWAYVFDRTLMNAITVTNSGFETGTATENDPITGWTRGTGINEWGVIATGALVGSKCLGGATASDGAKYDENYISQTIDLAGAGISTADIDAGKIGLALWTGVKQLVQDDMGRVVVDYLDASGVVVHSEDTRYFSLDKVATWREKAVINELFPGVRSVKISLWYQRRHTGGTLNINFDKLVLYWWDLTGTSPYGSVIHKCQRIIDVNSPKFNYPLTNPSFEQARVVNTNVSGAIAGTECTTADWWRTGADFNGAAWTVFSTPIHNYYMLVGGDDSSGTQKTYTIKMPITFVSGYINTDRLATGFIGGRLFWSMQAHRLTDQGAVKLEYYNGAGTLIGTSTLRAMSALAAIDTTYTAQANVFFPVGTVTAKIVFQVQTPTGTSVSQFMFDEVRLQAFDMGRANEYDLTVGQSVLTGSGFDHTGGSYTQDGNLVWRSYATQRGYDVVSSVPVADRKTFVGTTIAGSIGAFVTSPIKWLTGANAGRTNLIRGWNPSSQALKCYFPNIDPIQVGDKFQYLSACGKEFVPHCVATFNNGINFRGFPYVPGSLTAQQQGEANGTIGPSLPAPKTFTAVANKTGTQGGTTGTTTLPTGSAAGDILLMWKWRTGSVTALGAVSGFTPGTSVSADAGTRHAYMQVYYKLLTAADISTNSVPLEANCSWALQAIRGDNPPTFIALANGIGSGKAISSGSVGDSGTVSVAPGNIPSLAIAFGVADNGGITGLTGTLSAVAGVTISSGFAQMHVGFINDVRASNPDQTVDTYTVDYISSSAGALVGAGAYINVT